MSHYRAMRFQDVRAKGRIAEDAARLVGWSRAHLLRRQQTSHFRGALT